MKKIVFALLLLPACFAGLQAAPRYGFRHYSVRDGLASNTVRALIQDRQGLVWFGTGDGLQSFDGREMITHPLRGGSDYVNCLLEASDGTLWAGTDDAVFYMDKSGEFRRIPEEQLPVVLVNTLAEDREGGIWIGTIGGGAIRWKEGVATGYLPGEDVECIYVDQDNRIWACSPKAGDFIYMFNAAAEAFVPANFHYEGCTPTRVCAMTGDSEGNLWLGTWDKGLYRYGVQDRTVRLVAGPGPGFKHTHSLTEISPMTFLVGSDDGLLWVNAVTGDSRLYGNDRSNPQSLSNKFVYPVVLDHEGGLWVGTYYGGVNYAVPGFGQFDALSVSEMTGGQEEYTVSCFCEDPDGTLWLGSDNGGLFHLDPQTDRALDFLSTLNVHALYREGNDLWIGSYSGGIDRMDVRSGRVRSYLSPGNSSFFSITGLRDTLWVGSMTGISRYDSALDQFVQEKEVGTVTSSMAADENGNLWCSTTGKGLLMRTPEGEWQHFLTAGSALPSDVVNCLFPVHGGVYVGTKSGLVFISDSLKIRPVLPDVDVCSIVTDGTRLWISTGKGLLRSTLSGGSMERFGENDGVLRGPFVPGAGLITTDGRIYFGATDGFVSFYPGKVVINRVVPTVLIPRFLAFPGNGGPVENVLKMQGEADNIRLPWRLRNVRFSFAALSYCAPEKNRFSYILEGYDKVWRDSDGLNWAEYNRLPAGHYRFRVIASNNDGLWNREGAEVSFTIRPHFLLSHFALVLYVLLFALLVFLLIRTLVRRYERRYREQYDELKTPISRITAPLERIRSRRADLPEELRKDLDVIDRNSRRLVTMVNQLQGEKIPQPRLVGDAPEEGDFITRLNAVIRDNLSNTDLSVSLLSSEMAVSRSGLFTKVKEATGETPNGLIVRTRLKAAADLLAKGKNSVGEVCYMVGFSSPSYFSKSFVKEYGVTPVEWVRSHKH